MKLTEQKLYKLIQEQYELNIEQREKLLVMLTTDIESAIQALELIDALDIGYAKGGLLGDALMLSGKDYKKRKVHTFLVKVAEEEFYKNFPGNLKEATGEQKRQQKRDAYAAKEKQRRKMKARIKRSQNKGESSYKNERPDFDPIKDLGKAMKKRYKDLEVRANGEEIED